MTDGPLRADFTTLADLKHDMVQLAEALDDAAVPLNRAHTSVVSGAGDFASELASGASTFLLSWVVATRTMSDGSALVGNNIGKAAVDLRAVDSGLNAFVEL
jgi:hypothetical protein